IIGPWPLTNGGGSEMDVVPDHDSARPGVISPPGLLAGALFVVMGWLMGWDALVFRAIARLFYEQSALAALREPSQLALAHNLLLVWLGFPVLLAIAGSRVTPHARRFVAIMACAYAIRAAIWVAGSNLP